MGCRDNNSYNLMRFKNAKFGKKVAEKETITEKDPSHQLEMLMQMRLIHHILYYFFWQSVMEASKVLKEM